MKNYVLLLATAVLGFNLSAQIPSKSKKLAGTWDYKEGSGFEVWKMNGDEIVGAAYRVNPKTLDTSKVEGMVIRKPGRHLLCATETYNIALDGSLVARDHNFIADRNRMKFFNLSNLPPYAVEYKFGWFNKKKMKVSIYHGPHDKPLKLVLYKQH
ncbi:MAG: hypothetical protein P8H56_10175 [Crocinitomicaceae bacterium]|nr:hypothetical protein [Crocinitomicaceae bacterium]MDG1658940.1 hypothetical protein [Crocinitomicaceae bacterium]